jgi:hypothetical protein
MLKFNMNTLCNVGEINKNDEAFVKKPSSVYSAKYEINSSFT